jgi:hypothetical protein
MSPDFDKAFDEAAKIRGSSEIEESARKHEAIRRSDLARSITDEYLETLLPVVLSKLENNGIKPKEMISYPEKKLKIFKHTERIKWWSFALVPFDEDSSFRPTTICLLENGKFVQNSPHPRSIRTGYWDKNIPEPIRPPLYHRHEIASTMDHQGRVRIDYDKGIDDSKTFADPDSRKVFVVNSHVFGRNLSDVVFPDESVQELSIYIARYISLFLSKSR